MEDEMYVACGGCYDKQEWELEFSELNPELYTCATSSEAPATDHAEQNDGLCATAAWVPVMDVADKTVGGAVVSATRPHSNILSCAKHKLRVSARFMKQRRRTKWCKDYSWVKGDLERLISSQEVLPEDLQDFSLPIVIVGSDVEALYPNLSAERVAKLIYEAIIKSEVEWDNISYMEGLRYIALN
jgi:hypothetical protein